jgi:hypothetical protein
VVIRLTKYVVYGIDDWIDETCGLAPMGLVIRLTKHTVARMGGIGGD